MKLQDLIEQHMTRAITAGGWYRRSDIVLPISVEDLYIITGLAKQYLAEHPDKEKEHVKSP